MTIKSTVSYHLSELRRLHGERRLSDWVAQVERQLGPAPPELAAELQGLLVVGRWYAEASEGRFAEGLPEAVRAIERLRGWELDSRIDWLLSVAGFAIGVAGQLEQGLQWVLEARELAQSSEDDGNLLSVLTSQGALYSLSGDYEAAARVFEEAAVVGPETGTQRIVLLNNHSFTLSCWARSLPSDDRRRSDIAADALRHAVDAMAMTPPEYGERWQAWALANQSHALALLGRLPEAEHAYVTAIALARDNLRVQVTAMAGYARLLTEAARYDEARRLLKEAFDKAPTNLLDMTVDLVLEAFVNLEVSSGHAEEVAIWSNRRRQRLEDQYRARLGNVVRQAELLADMQRERLQERQRSEQAVLQSRLDARESLLRDLHDGFGSQLASARLKAERGALSQQALVELLDECLSDLYLVVDSIDNADGDLGQALRLLRNRLDRRMADGDTRVHWQIDLDALAPLGAARMTSVLRFVQEALANALKHARAGNVFVSATSSHDGAFRITIRDDGRGIPPAPAEGAGLKNLKARAALLNGALRIGSGGAGTSVELLVPA